jgi:membrane protein DedA with SNARE-associated domain
VTIEALVARWGVAAVFAGAALEGEAAVTAGGLLAHQGLISLPGAMLAAALGSFLADQGWFAFGRRFRDHRWVVKIRARPAFQRAVALVERRPIGFIFAFRFLWGLRTVSPIAIGTTQVPLRLYAAVNFASAATWGVLFTSIGYLFGEAFEEVMGRLRHDARLWWLVGGLLAAGVLFGAWRWYQGRRS